MNKLLSFLLLFLLPAIVLGQHKKPTQAELNAVLDDGLELWQLELATTYSTEFLFEQLSREGLSGYFSYKEGDTIRTVFYEGERKKEAVKYTFTFTIPVTRTFVSLEGTTRKMTDLEARLLKVRNRVIRYTNKKHNEFDDGKGTNLNLTTLHRNGAFVAYLIPAAVKEGFVPLGNDHRFFYSEKGKMLGKEQLHQNAIPINTGTGKLDPGPGVATMHTHSNASSTLITPTDISQLMLYREYCSWTDHYVIGEEYVCYFSTESQELILMTREEFRQFQSGGRKP